jgi:hypothetical protein
VVNTSKLDALAASLQESFSGKIVSGGEKLIAGASPSEIARPEVTPPLPAITPAAALAEQTATTAQEIERRSDQEEEELSA